MYFGTQEILQEEELDNGMVKVTLKIDQEVYPGNLKEEDVFLKKEAFDEAKSDECVTDLTLFRNKMCDRPVGDILLILMQYGVRKADLEYVMGSVLASVNMADEKSIAEARGVTDNALSIYHLKGELMKKS